MGKYDAVLASLPRFPAELQDGGSNRQFEIDQLKTDENFPDRTPSGLLVRYASIRKEKEELEEGVKEKNTLLAAAEQLLLAVYEGEGITSLQVKGIGTVRTQYEPYSSVTDKEAFHEWCLQNGFGPQMQLAWQTMNSVSKERLLNAEEPPPGITVYVKPKTVLTREK